MWASQEVTALKVGLTLDYYWGDITPKIVTTYANAYQEKLDDQVRTLDATNHVLGVYIRAAIVDALSGKSNYPEQPVTAKRQSSLKKVFSKEEVAALIEQRKQQAKQSD